MIAKRLSRFNALIVILAMTWGCATTPSGTETTSKPQVDARILAKSSESWDGRTLPPYPSTQPEITIMRLSIPPGTKLPWHKHPVINAGVLVQGELTVITEDGQTLVLRAGDPIIEVVETMHYGFNSGQTDADIIVFYAGTPDKAVTVLQQ
jgi:quercetin dioxygenase-like cupin family protein